MLIWELYAFFSTYPPREENALAEAAAAAAAGDADFMSTKKLTPEVASPQKSDWVIR